KAIDQWLPRKSELDDRTTVTLALALDSKGRRDEAIQLLRDHQRAGTDILGVLAGRLKRRWLVERRRADADSALELYGKAYGESTKSLPPNHDQAYYHGINVAFMELAYGGDYQAARAMAAKVLDHCAQAAKPDERMWRLATEGDALIILGRNEEAYDKHAQAAAVPMQPWQSLSIEEQAIRLTNLCGWDHADIERLLEPYERAES